MDFCYEAFPQLAERRRKLAGSLAGGEQQMLALGRALMLAPRILPIDEPSVGLAPLMVARTIDNPSWSPQPTRRESSSMVTVPAGWRLSAGRLCAPSRRRVR
jgi:ABC-type polar amino acid transport system ATPase subunit